MGAKTSKTSKSALNSSSIMVKPIKKASNARVSYPSPKGRTVESPKATPTNLGKDHDNPVTLIRMASKKEKIVIKAKPMLNKEKNEASVLQVIKKNNYDYEDEEMINNCLTKHFFMRSLEKEGRNEIIKEMTLCSVNQGECLFKQGSTGNYFYIVKYGETELFINDVFIRKFTQGDSFGELALLHCAPRSGTVRVTVSAQLYCLERRNFRKIVDHINSLNFEENKQFINAVGILANIDNEFKSVLASQLIKQYYDAKTLIVKQGDISSCLFIIKEGEVDCVASGKTIRTLKKGDHFGDKSILLESTRTMDVIAKTSCVIYAISIETLKNMVGDKYKDVLFLNFIKMAFTQSKYFSKINMKLVENAYESFKIKNFSRGEVVLKSGLVFSTKFIIIIEGSLVNPKLNQLIGKRGDILFEDYLSTQSKDKLNFDLVAEPDCLIMEANTTDFIKLVGGNNSFKEILMMSTCLDSLIKIPLFKNFPIQKLEMLSGMLTQEHYENGKKIICQGENDNKFYLIKSGKVDILINNNYIRTMNVNEHFGERALFFHEPRTATAQANGPVELYVIRSKEFKMLLEENLENYLKDRFYLQDNTIELKDLDYLQDLGQGNFGAVVLARHRKNLHKYAVKSINKKQIDMEQLHVNLDLERGILLKIDHPFIVKLVKTLKTDRMIFFLMEYIRGKELFDVIRAIGLLNKSQTQFYGASLMLAIDYLHERNCVYRDIKPENVMICENGYAKLVDFGTVKEITDRTTTIIGTPHYMSPDVVTGDGYTFAVDFWSIAVCLFEFMCGSVPFGDNVEEPMDIYLEIINSDLIFPSFIKDKDFMHLMNKMLHKNQMSRYSKFSQIKAHPWFSAFNWEELISFSMYPPHLPKVSNDEPVQSPVAFVNYLKTIKEFSREKSVKIDKRNQDEYDQWFKKF